MIRLCAGLGVQAFRTKDTGIWCTTPTGATKKIGSIGLHLRRNITTHGIGLNITNEITPYFDRIDACGLAMGITTLEEMGVLTSREDVEGQWAEIMGEELGGQLTRPLSDVRELEMLWQLKAGEIYNVMFNDNQRDSVDTIQ